MDEPGELPRMPLEELRSQSEEVAVVEAVNGEVRLEEAAIACPAKSHINQCTCNFELELKGELIL